MIGEVPMLARADKGIDNQADSEQDKGDAEHLSDIHSIPGNHFHFRADLHVLYVFYKEARAESDREENSRQEPGSLLGIPFPIHPHQQTEKA